MRWNLDQTQLSISTRALSRDLRAAIDAAARAGFAAIELWEEDTEQLGGYRAAARYARDSGLRISSYQVIRDVDGVDGACFNTAIEQANRLIRHAAEVGADSVLACSSLHPNAIFDEELARHQLGMVTEIAASVGMPLAFESLSMARHRARWVEAWSLVREIDNPMLGLALDSTHCAIMGESVEAVREIDGSRIGFVQLADLKSTSGDVFDLNRNQRLFPGEGILDLDSFMEAVLATGYKGTVSLEVFNAANMKRPAQDNAARAMASFLLPQE